MDFQTPEWLCKYLVDLIPPNSKTILEPTPGEGNLVKAIKNGGYEVVAANNFWDITGRYDACAMNPPFSPMEVGYKILFKCMEMTDFIVAVMPWLTLINSVKRTNLIFDWGVQRLIGNLNKSTK